jgi:general secretion pathway protein A
LPFIAAEEPTVHNAFYGLKKDAFEISPDPSFFYPTAQHKQAFATLYSGVKRHKGFSVLTGQAGTGKTLLVRWLAGVLEGLGIGVVYVFNPQLSAADFVDYILTDLRLSVPAGRKSSSLFALSDYLIAQHERGSTTVLIVDEAHLISRELVEEIRLLTNLETPRQKLLQIILAGQPELDQMIDSPDLPQLKQRVAVRCRLERLKGPEIEAYVLRRLEVASPNSQSRVIFSKPAIAAIERYSQGIPRLMNTICENALAIGCASQTPIVNAKIIEEVANHFGFREEIPSSPDGNYHLGPVEPAEAFSGQAQTLSAGRRTPARVMNMP